MVGPGLLREGGLSAVAGLGLLRVDLQGEFGFPAVAGPGLLGGVGESNFFVNRSAILALSLLSFLVVLIIKIEQVSCQHQCYKNQ